MACLYPLRKHQMAMSTANSENCSGAIITTSCEREHDMETKKNEKDAKSNECFKKN